MNASIYIKKESGERAVFSEQKYRASLRRSGASDQLIEDVWAAVAPHMYDGMTTHELYRHTYEILHKKERKSVAGRYNLKQAIMQLGPSGFSFEKYIAEILKRQGYDVLVDQEVPGKCVSHEVDVVAVKAHDRFIIECKFHHEAGVYCSIQTVLYMKARYDDIQARPHKLAYTDCWLVTNAKFSSVAIQYGECVGMKMLAWSYPAGNSLEKIVDAQGLHPVTCLASLPKPGLAKLLQAGVVLCCDISKHRGLLSSAHLNEKKIDEIVQEAQEICRGE